MVEFKGISFPFRISPTTGGVEVATYSDDGRVDLIRQSIIQIVSTRLGERVQEKYFGTDLGVLSFDPNDEITEAVLRQAITQALITFEPRITVQEVTVEREMDAGKLMVNISYFINRISQTDSFAFLL